MKWISKISAFDISQNGGGGHRGVFRGHVGDRGQLSGVIN